MSTKEIRDIGLPPAQQALSDLWDEHVRDEFAIKDADAALDTMTPDAYVNHVPVLTGGVGKEELREFYAKHFIPKMPGNCWRSASRNPSRFKYDGAFCSWLVRILIDEALAIRGHRLNLNTEVL